jgi:oxygen-dependent protoporphyrinogen oxidase
MLVSAIPAYAAADIVKDLDIKTAEHLLNIYYPPVLVLYVGYEKSSINRPLDGFGFLIPSKENKSFLGAIWSSVLFPERCGNDKASFTIFVGGSRNPQIAEQDKNEIVARVLKEFHEIMKINSDPVFLSSKFWEKAIPQYNLGYIEHENAFIEFENKFPGFFLAGNYRGGISIGDCVKSSEQVYKKIIGLSSS